MRLVLIALLVVLSPVFVAVALVLALSVAVAAFYAFLTIASVYYVMLGHVPPWELGPRAFTLWIEGRDTKPPRHGN